jgi:hypothetical protein
MRRIVLKTFDVLQLITPQVMRRGEIPLYYASRQSDLAPLVCKRTGLSVAFFRIGRKKYARCLSNDVLIHKSCTLFLLNRAVDMMNVPNQAK